MDTPRILNPQEAQTAREILDRPHSVPKGHTAKTDIRPAHREQISPAPARLDPDKAWHLLGMAYWIVGLDRSAFSLFAAALNTEVQVTTYQAVDQLFQVADMANDPTWTHMIQGIDPTLHQQFVDHLESYEFRRPKGICSLKAFDLYLADPFAVDQELKVTLWLPERPGRRAGVERMLTRTPALPTVRFMNAP